MKAAWGNGGGAGTSGVAGSATPVGVPVQCSATTPFLLVQGPWNVQLRARPGAERDYTGGPPPPRRERAAKRAAMGRAAIGSAAGVSWTSAPGARY